MLSINDVAHRRQPELTAELHCYIYMLVFIIFSPYLTRHAACAYGPTLAWGDTVWFARTGKLNINIFPQNYSVKYLTCL